MFSEIAEELARNGFEAEPFGSRSIAVKVSPAGIDAAQVEHMLTELLEQFSREEQSLNMDTDSHAYCRVDRLPRRHQGEHAARAEQNGMAACRTRQDRSSDDLPARPSGGIAVFDEGYSEGV